VSCETKPPKLKFAYLICFPTRTSHFSLSAPAHAQSTVSGSVKTSGPTLGVRRCTRGLETVRTQSDFTVVRNDWTAWKSGCWFSNMVQLVQLHIDGAGRYKEPLFHLITPVCHLAHRLGGQWSWATFKRQTSWQNMPTDSCHGKQWPCITWQSKQSTKSILCTT